MLYTPPYNTNTGHIKHLDEEIKQKKLMRDAKLRITNFDDIIFGLCSGVFYDKNSNAVIIEKAVEKESISYSEEELVPSQFFGLNDYLKIKQW